MDNNSKKIALIAIFSALYASSVIILAPISFGIYQIRLADALLPLSMIFGLPGALGFGFGALLSNLYGTLGLLDIIGGATANLLACIIAYYFAKKRGIIFRLIGSILETIIITIIVGGYLSVIFDVPIELSLLGVLGGSIVAINLIGFPLQETIRKSSIYKRLVNE